MKKAEYHFRRIFGIIGLFLLFLLNFCYIFASIGILTLGLIALPSSFLGETGIITIITDLADMPLLLISGGLLVLGMGMCFGIFTVCPASYEAVKRFIKKADFMRKRVYDEE